jgi:hypothetical protein
VTRQGVGLPAKHLLTVWNPAYAADPLDAHLAILLEWAERYRSGACGEDDVYVWWAKLRSPNRDAARLPHHAEIVTLQKQIEAGTETHLYLTDYRSLYVASLEDVLDDNLLDEDEADHMPAYYATQRADLWFRIVDVRRIVADDTLAVIDELKRLSNTRYHERPVSLYGGMVELPLIVTRADGRSWFPDAPTLTDGRLWVEHDADSRTETDLLARELRDNLLGPVVWSVLDVATRSFLASAEATFRSRRNDPHFDFSGPAIGYAKAVEAELNALLFGSHVMSAAGRLPPADRTARVDGRPLDLGGSVPHQPLGAVLNLLRFDDAMARCVRGAFSAADAKWLLGTLPHLLETVVALRNPAAHSASSRREDVGEVREKVLGIGCEGMVAQLARVRLRVVN